MYGYTYYPYHSAAASVPVQPSSPPVIEVFGEGNVSVSPDRAIVIVGAVTEGGVLTAVQAENAKIIEEVIGALLKLNISREKIQTHDFRIEPQYDYVEGKQVFRGYKVTHLLQIMTDDVRQTGIIVDTAVSHGANSITSIQFSAAHPELFENQALTLAIRNARQKASTVANALGVTLAAAPSQVQELSPGTQPIAYKTPMLMGGAATPIEPGELTISAAVKVTYHYG